MATGKTQEAQREAKAKAEREANRHQSNVDLNQQAKDGLRTRIPVGSLVDGMRVIVSPQDNNFATGTVVKNKDDDKLIDIIGDDGQPLLTGIDPTPGLRGNGFLLGGTGGHS